MVKLAQRTICPNGHDISIGLTGNIGYVSITDTNLYPDDDSRSERRDLNYHIMMIPLLTRKDLIALRTAIDEVLENSK
jgi:hypothetical protein